MFTIKDEKTGDMRKVWNALCRKSKFGFISYLQFGAKWNDKEFHLTGIRFVDRMSERFLDYGCTEPSQSSILEIGCGVGRFLKPLACRFKHVYGVDISKQMLGVAKKHCACLPNITFILNDGITLNGVADSSVEYCVSAGVFQHITHIGVISSYIREAIRVLKPGGIFLLQFEGNRTDTVGRDTTGARITASDLDETLTGLPFRIREVSLDPKDPVRNIVLVMQKLKDGETAGPAEQSFKRFQMIERRWISGVYDDIQTKTAMHLRLKEEPKRLTFYD